jgi:plastocyanin
MNRYLATAGVILLLLAAFFFLAVFSGGSVGPYAITDGLPLANFAAMLFAIIFLPVGCGLAFVGFANRGPAFTSIEAQGRAGGQRGVSGPAPGSGLARAALAVSIIAILISAGTLAAVIAVSGQVSTLSGKGSGSSSTSGAVSGSQFSVRPTAVGFKLEWCNNDPAGQDRFCPSQLTVYQGDVVEILFISNDTDAHTFSLLTPNFQINDSFAGAHNFLSNAIISGSCSNSGSFSAISAGTSGTYCVSGSNLLSNSSLTTLTGSTTFPIAQNPTPAVPLNGTTPLLLQVNDKVDFVNVTSAAITAGHTELWGIGAFQVTTPGIYEFFCHYHVSNGMFGYLVVLPNAYCTSNPSACGGSNSTSTTTTT